MPPIMGYKPDDLLVDFVSCGSGQYKYVLVTVKKLLVCAKCAVHKINLSYTILKAKLPEKFYFNTMSKQELYVLFVHYHPTLVKAYLGDGTEQFTAILNRLWWFRL